MPANSLSWDKMALNYRNHVCCSFYEQSNIRQKGAMLRSNGVSLPIRAPRYNTQRVTAVYAENGPKSPQQPTPGSRTLRAAAVAPQVEQVAAAQTTNGRGDSSHHDNNYVEPVLRPSTLTVHGGEGSQGFRSKVAAAVDMHCLSWRLVYWM